MGLKGDVRRIQDFKKRLRDLPTSLAHDLAQRAAPEITGATKEAFASGRSVYGDARPPGKAWRWVKGKGWVTSNARPPTLIASGAVARQLGFVANGTQVRCVLGPQYAKYLIGRYGILPNGALPVDWSRRLSELVRTARPAL